MFSKNDLRRLHVFKQSLVAWGLSLCAVFGSQVAHAAVEVPDSAFQRFMVEASGVGKQTISFGSNGTPVLSPGVPTLSTNGGSGVAFARSGTILNPAGEKLAINATGKLAALSIGPLIARAAGLLSPVAGALVAGVGIYDFYKEMGYTPVQNPDGTLAVTKQSSTKEWYKNPGGWMASPDDFCHSVGSFFNQNSALPGPDAETETIKCTYSVNGATQYINAPIRTTVTGNSPATQQQFIDDVAAKSGWPSTSQITKAIAEAQKIANESLLYDPASMTFTGPATSTGKTTTTTNPDGSTTTTTTNYNHTYEGAKVTTGAVTTTTNNNPVTNTTTTTVTTTTPDTPQKTDCELDPEAIGCKHLDVPTDKVPTKEETITWAEENLGFGPGACPSPYQFSVMQTLYPKTYTIDLAQFCSTMSSVVRPLVILFSLLAAFFIVAPVTTREI